MNATVPVPIHRVVAPEPRRPGVAPIPGAMSTVLDNDTSAMGLAYLLAIAAFIEGSQPHWVTRHLDRVRDDVDLLPAGSVPVRVVVEPHSTCRVALGDDWSLISWKQRDGGANVAVTAASEEAARDVLDAATAGAEVPAPVDDTSVDVGFWRSSQHGPRRSERRIVTPAWNEIRRNYTDAAANAFDRLLGIEDPEEQGRLLLLHGPPGTGKTTSIRALARSWRSWCTVDLVVDPERFLSDPNYLLHVVVDAAEEDRWRLLVLEDCDELLRTNAKEGTGQGLSRLLNVTDGLLGQGSQVLVCLTTNEELGRLHPAVVRPGRCLARIFVDKLRRDEAIAWLGPDAARLDVPPHGATLAEFCELRGELAPVRLVEPDRAVGQYL